jgi:hypothetical protein
MLVHDIRLSLKLPKYNDFTFMTGEYSKQYFRINGLQAPRQPIPSPLPHTGLLKGLIYRPTVTTKVENIHRKLEWSPLRASQTAFIPTRQTLLFTARTDAGHLPSESEGTAVLVSGML